jgi:hypothetical protein
VRAAVLNDFPKMANAAPLLITDDVVFRWARITKIARLLPVMNEVRVLERALAANSCRSCRKPVEVDRSVLNTAKAALGECSDETALLVKQAAGVVKYKVVYRKLASAEPPKEIIR